MYFCALISQRRFNKETQLQQHNNEQQQNN